MSQKASCTTNWIAHRGLSLDAPENSRGAFKDAKRAGFQFVETDLRISRDGHLILSHDPDLARLGGPKQPVWTMSRKELEDTHLTGGESPLFFDEFLTLARSMSWVFDIKKEYGMKTLLALKTWIESYGRGEFLAKSWFLFWDHDQRSWWTQAFPEANIFASERECWRAGLANLGPFANLAGVVPAWGYAVPPRFCGASLFRKKIFKKYQDRSAYVIAYLPTTDAEAQNALDAGADFILTDHHMI